MELIISEAARKKIEEMQTEERKARIYMGGTSCSGVILGLAMNPKQDGDIVVNVDGLEVYVQGELEELAPKMHVNYEDSGLKMGFSVSEAEQKNYC